MQGKELFPHSISSGMCKIIELGGGGGGEKRNCSHCTFVRLGRELLSSGGGGGGVKL